MSIIQTYDLKTNKNFKLNGPKIIITNKHEDERGFFIESWNKKIFQKAIGEEIDFLQDNQSFSYQGVLRGLHYQLNPYPQGKLIKVLFGTIFDVIVDLRQNSKTFSQWAAVEISDQKHNQLWVPRGFAHGFLVLSEFSIVEYKVDNFWQSKSEKSLLWNDKQINVNWPLKRLKNGFPTISEKDKNADNLEEIIRKGELF